MKALIIVIIPLLFLGCLSQYEGPAGEHKKEVLQIFEDTIEQEFLSMDLSTSSGYIKIHFWDNPSCKIEVTKWAMGDTATDAKTRAENVQVSFSMSKKEKAVLLLDVEQTRDTGAHVEVFIPRLSFLDVRLSTTNGFIEVEDINAQSIFLEVENGFIEVENISADSVTLKVVNGYIKGKINKSQIDMEAENGVIDLQIK